MERSVDTIVQFSGLKPGVYTFQFVLNDSFFSDYKNEKILGGEVVFDVKLEKKERLMMFFFAYSGEVRTTCDRCLEEMLWPVSGEQSLCVKFSDTEKSYDEDVIFLPENAFQIDLGQWMYEYVAVAMPIQCVHPDDEEGHSTCNPEMMSFITERDEGSGAGESQDDSVDPRWEALRQLRD